MNLSERLTALRRQLAETEEELARAVGVAAVEGRELLVASVGEASGSALVSAQPSKTIATKLIETMSLASERYWTAEELAEVHSDIQVTTLRTTLNRMVEKKQVLRNGPGKYIVRADDPPEAATSNY